MVTWPGNMMVMTPVHMHMQVQVLVSAGKPLIRTIGDPGVQGLAVAGTHGPGTGAPIAAALAAMTAGLVGLLHIPNVGIFAIGAKSMIVAYGPEAARTGTPFGMTVSGMGTGGSAIAHEIIAPVQTT